MLKPLLGITRREKKRKVDIRKNRLENNLLPELALYNLPHGKKGHRSFKKKMDSTESPESG